MAELVVGSLVMAMGLIAAGVGVIIARRALQTAQRAHHRTAAISAATLEGWDSWFLGGFSHLAMGIHWLYAVSVWLAWTLAGAGLIGLGIGLLLRV